MFLVEQERICQPVIWVYLPPRSAFIGVLNPSPEASFCFAVRSERYLRLVAHPTSVTSRHRMVGLHSFIKRDVLVGLPLNAVEWPLLSRLFVFVCTKAVKVLFVIGK